MKEVIYEKCLDNSESLNLGEVVTLIEKMIHDNRKVNGVAFWSKDGLVHATVSLVQSKTKGFDEYGNYGENNGPLPPMSNPGDKDYEC